MPHAIPISVLTVCPALSTQRTEGTFLRPRSAGAGQHDRRAREFPDPSCRATDTGSIPRPLKLTTPSLHIHLPPFACRAVQFLARPAVEPCYPRPISELSLNVRTPDSLPCLNRRDRYGGRRAPFPATARPVCGYALAPLRLAPDGDVMHGPSPVGVEMLDIWKSRDSRFRFNRDRNRFS